MCIIQKIVLFIVFLLATTSSKAAVPLVLEAEIVGANLQFWWQNANLVSTEPGSGIYVQPLNNNEALSLKSLNGWKEIGAICGKDFRQLETINSQEVLLITTTTKKGLHLQMKMNEVIIAENRIARPAHFCSLEVLQADEINGPEIIIFWSMGNNLKGASIFRVPETVQ